MNISKIQPSVCFYIKGDWGYGKTSFVVSNRLNSYKRNLENYILKPKSVIRK